MRRRTDRTEERGERTLVHWYLPSVRGPQAGGSHTPNSRPRRRRRRQPGAVLPLGGAVAQVAPMCANAGLILASQRPDSMVCVYWADSAGALRVTARHSAKPVTL